MNIELLISVASLGISLIAASVSIRQNRQHKKAIKNIDAKNAEMDQWVFEQIARWRRGEIEGTVEPSISGNGDVMVIEPAPGHRIVVGTVRNGKLDSEIDYAKFGRGFSVNSVFAENSGRRFC